MDSLLAVEKEVDKAIDSFEAFYQGVDDDVDQALESLLASMNELMKADSDQALAANSLAYIQQCKEQIKDCIKKYSDKHKDLHGSISKIGKVIDKVRETGWKQQLAKF